MNWKCEWNFIFAINTKLLLVQLLKSSSNEWRCTINILSHYRTSLRIHCHIINKLKKLNYMLQFCHSLFPISPLLLRTTIVCFSLYQFLFLFYLFSLFFNRTLENGTTLTSSQRLKLLEQIEKRYIEQQQQKILTRERYRL